MKYKQVIGIDVAKKKLDFYNSKTQQHGTVENSQAAITSFLQEFKRSKSKTLVVMEATGGYESVLIELLHNQGIDCSVVNPLQIRQFARGCGLIEKNDTLDAQIIARFGEVVEPKLREKPTESEAKLKALVHRRDQILKQISSEKNRVQQTADSETKAMIQNAIAFYKTQIREVDKRISQVLQECQTLAAKASILQSCPSVGAATTGILLAELPELGQLNRGQVAKLVGVAPIAKDSGQHSGKRKTYAGRSMVRKVLYMAALVATKYNPRLQAFYQRLVIKGKPKKLALVAVMRKLLVTLNLMLRNQQPWSETTLAPLDKY